MREYVKYIITYIDPETGAQSPIDVVTGPAGYTAADYVRDCEGNAPPEWVEMLHAGSVTVEAITE